MIEFHKGEKLIEDEFKEWAKAKFEARMAEIDRRMREDTEAEKDELLSNNEEQP